MSLHLLLKGQLAFLASHFEVLAVASPGADLEKVAVRENVAVVGIPMERGIHVVKDVQSLWRLYRLFRKEKPDIVHSITPKAGLLSMIAAKVAGVPIRMHTFTGLVFPSKNGFLKRLLISLDRLLCLCATHVIPEGEGVRQDLLRYRITQKPLHIIGNGNVNGIDIDYFSSQSVDEQRRKELANLHHLDATDFVFLFVGRLVKDKGVHELLSAFVRLEKEERERAENPKQIKLFLVGPFEEDLDPLDSEVLHEIFTHPRIFRVGYREDVRPYFALSSCLLLPSYREGFPNVVLQAGAMGLPSIVTQVNGSSEIIEDGRNGIIIPTQNEIALQDAMRKLLEPNLNFSMGANARELIERKFQDHAFWDALLKVYQAALNKNKT